MPQQKVAIVTGVTGQDGSILSELLLNKGYKVFGTIRRSSRGIDLGNAASLQGHPNLEVVEVDITDLSSIIHLCKLAKAHLFFNTASQSHVGTSFTQPIYTAEATGISVLNCLEAIRTSGYHTRFLNFATSEMFGGIYNKPCNEETPLYPRSPYAAAKCLTARTKIFTKNGLVQINKIKVGDEVWTHKGTLSKVKSIFSRKYMKELINIRAISSTGSGKKKNYPQSNFQITCTPEHKILTDRGWIEAQYINKSDNIYIVATRCKYCGKKIPANREVCSQKCNTKYRMDNNKQFKDKSIKNLKKYTSKMKEEGYYNSKEFREKTLNGIAKYLQKKGINGVEKYIDLLIQECAPGFFKYVGDGTYRVGNYFPDWINKEKKAIIEFVGYGATMKDRMKQFKKKCNTYEELGYKYLVLYGKDFSNPFQIQEKVAKFCSDLGSVEFIQAKIDNIHRYQKKNNNLVYDLEVENDHSYIANGIIVHNCFAFHTTRNYREAYRMFACSTICFNHEEPGKRGPNFVTRKISLGVANIKAGKQDYLYLGNLDAKRDWGVASDFCKGMISVLEASEPDDFVLATGETHTVREFCSIAFDYAGLGDYQQYVKIDPQFFRPTEVDVLIGDYSKINKKLSWAPTTSFEDLVKKMVDHDISLIK